MVARSETEPQNAASAASQILHAWRSGQRPQVDQWRTQVWDALEAERMEVLESVVETLQSRTKLPPEKVRAAVRLLEHLAQAPLQPTQD